MKKIIVLVLCLMMVSVTVQARKSHRRTNDVDTAHMTKQQRSEYYSARSQAIRDRNSANQNKAFLDNIDRTHKILDSQKATQRKRNKRHQKHLNW